MCARNEFIIYLHKNLRLDYLRFKLICWVKYMLASCGLHHLFFVVPVLFFIIGGTYVIEKNANGTSIPFFHPKLTEIHVSATFHHSKCNT
jgi:hypothetical protein